MIENQKRNGNFTSSEIFLLLSKKKGTPENYIDECNMERRLDRSITKDENARPLSWGKLVEQRAFELLGMEYKLSSEETVMHPEINYWSGSPDGNKFDEDKTVFDIKCPTSLKSFCQLVDCVYVKELSGIEAINEVRENHKDGEKFYQQLVSNAILTSSKYAELIIYCPYKSELGTIRDLAQQNDKGEQGKTSWIYWSFDDELPWIKDEGFYKNLTVIRFEVPIEDKQALTDRVIEAGKKLINQKELVNA